MGCSINLCFVMMLWTARAKLSVPPPGPAVAMNSIGLTGCHAASAAPDRPTARPTASTVNVGFRDIESSRSFCFPGFHFALADPVLHKVCSGHRAFLLERGDFISVKTVCAQNRAGVLAIEWRAGSYLAGRLREFDRQSERLDGAQR